MRLPLWLALVSIAQFAVPATAFAAAVCDFDIMGLRLGMTAEQALAAAASQNLSKVRRSPAPTFEQAVSMELNKHVPVPEYGSVRRIELDSDRETVALVFAPSPSGAQLVKIHYSFFGAGVTSAQMTEQVVAKYGEPDGRVLGRSVWGDTGLPLGRTRPSLEYDEHPPSSLGRKIVGSLTLADPKLEQEATAAVKAAASQVASGKDPNF